MADEKQQDGQKTIVAFVVGLLIGGMLVWAFSGPQTAAPAPEADDATTTDEVTNESDDASSDESNDTTEDTRPTLQVGDGNIIVQSQPAGTMIALESATYPVSEGWVGVREFNDEQLGYILGVVRFSESQGLVPENIILQRATTAGKQYAVVVYTEDGDREFNPRFDAQIDTIFDTFTAE